MGWLRERDANIHCCPCAWLRLNAYGSANDYYTLAHPQQAELMLDVYVLLESLTIKPLAVVFDNDAKVLVV